MNSQDVCSLSFPSSLSSQLQWLEKGLFYPQVSKAQRRPSLPNLKERMKKKEGWIPMKAVQDFQEGSPPDLAYHSGLHQTSHQVRSHIFQHKRPSSYADLFCPIWTVNTIMDRCHVYQSLIRLPSGSVVKNSPANGGDAFDPWVGKIPWRRKWPPTPVLLPGKSHGQKSLVGYSPWDCRIGCDVATKQEQQQQPPSTWDMCYL